MKRYSRNEEGVTLIEVLVVIAIMATLSLVTIGIITSLFDSSIRTSKYLEQNTTIETMYGFMASRLSLTNVGDIGTLTASGNAINPTSIAGDQFVFVSSSGVGATGSQLCYRMFYLKKADPPDFPVDNSVWVATGPTTNNCETIAPTRGPNQTGGPTDPVLDNGAGNPFVIANKVVSENDEFSIIGTTGPNKCSGADAVGNKAFNRDLIPFYFCNNSLSTSYSGAPDGPSPIAKSTPDIQYAGFYNDISNREAIRGVQSVSYIDAGVAPTIPVRAYSQLFSLGQVQTNSCALDTAGQNIVVDLPAPEAWNEVGPSSVPFENNWSNYFNSYTTAAYYKDDTTDMVHIKGMVQGGTGNGTVFTLPAPYRPAQRYLFTQTDSTGVVRVDVTTSGQVYVWRSGPAPWLSLDGISFRVPAP